jgi:hypothetical protein
MVDVPPPSGLVAADEGVGLGFGQALGSRHMAYHLMQHTNGDIASNQLCIPALRQLDSLGAATTHL